MIILMYGYTHFAGCYHIRTYMHYKMHAYVCTYVYDVAAHINFKQ